MSPPSITFRKPVVAFIASVTVSIVVATLRWGGLNESYWVDELHSAWCVEGDFRSVADAARLGHQSPVYFWMLWVWRQCVGGGEAAMRASSFAAITLGTACLSVALTRRTESFAAKSFGAKSFAAGSFAAGSFIVGGFITAVVAFDPHMAFYAGELRGYGLAIAVVMIAIATIVSVPALSMHRAALGMAIAAIIAMVLHPTAALSPTLAAMLLGGFARRSETAGRRFWIATAWVVLIGIAAAMWLWSTVLQSTWQMRSTWQSMGRLERWDQMRWLIPWAMTATLTPASQWIGWLWSKWFSTRQTCNRFTNTQIYLWVFWTTGIVTIVAIAWASTDRVPLWHVRYVATAYPFLLAAAGLSLKRWIETVSIAWNQGLRWRITSVVTIAATFALGCQGFDFPHPRRGEDWRGAIGRVRHLKNRHYADSFPSGTRVWVDARLIESESYVNAIARGDLRKDRRLKTWAAYLLFPLSGPYRCGDSPDHPIGPMLVHGSETTSTGPHFVSHFHTGLPSLWDEVRRTGRDQLAVIRVPAGELGIAPHPTVRVWAHGGVSVVWALAPKPAPNLTAESTAESIAESDDGVN